MSPQPRNYSTFSRPIMQTVNDRANGATHDRHNGVQISPIWGQRWLSW